MKGDGSSIVPVELTATEEDCLSKNQQEPSERQAKRTALDHPFSIESILNGTTKRKKRMNSHEVDGQESAEENEPLPLNALEKFASKTFSSMKTTSHVPARELEEPVIVRERLKLQLPSKPTTTKKARRKARTCFTNQQIYELERRFLYQKYLSPQDRDELSEMLNLSNAQVITWFQNRRAKLKRDIEEMRNDLAATRTLHAQTQCPEYHHRSRCTDCR